MAAPRAAVAAWLERAEAFLAGRGVDEAAANAEFLMAAALGCGRLEARVWGARLPSERQARRFWRLVQQRGRRIPLAYVLGSQPFLGLDISVTPAVLVPRPETEELVEAAVALAGRLQGLGGGPPPRPRRRHSLAGGLGHTSSPYGSVERLPGPDLHVLEIGTGSGCVAVALARRLPRALLYATDISPAALALAAENARRHQVAARVRFLREDLFKGTASARRGWADLLVSNPPYIPTSELARLAPEVLREPVLALDGGKDGLAAIRAIASDAPRLLKPGGALALEHGAGQAASARAILERAGFADVATRRDLQGVERIVLARRPA